MGHEKRSLINVFCTSIGYMCDTAGKEGQLDKRSPADDLRAMLKNQLEYYFSQ